MSVDGGDRKEWIFFYVAWYIEEKEALSSKSRKLDMKMCLQEPVMFGV